ADGGLTNTFARGRGGRFNNAARPRSAHLETPMTYQFLQVTHADHITTITLNRPQVMNAINRAMHFELQRAFDEFAAAPDQWICVVTGAGERAFCAGSDLKDAMHTLDAGDAAGHYPPNGYAGLIERFDLPKPIIA